ncbi:hypothetical protein ACS0TY_006604 [Phlomoides rotata]
MAVDPMEILYDATPSPQHEEHEDGVDYIEDLRMAANDGPLPGKGSFKKPTTNTRRIWTTHEEKVLINVLKELVKKGYKSDNGFRTGYLIKCEEIYPLMRGMRYKEWPYFPDWIDIFGLDRATGSVAEDVVEMAKRLKLMYGKPPPVVENQEHDGVNYGSEPHGSDGINGTRGNDPTEGESTAHGARNIARDTTNGARKKHKRSPETNGPSNME